MVAVLDAGLGAAALLRRPVTGRVVSVHRRAAYLRLDTQRSGAGPSGEDGELVALVAPGVEPGPLHVRVTDLPACRAGERVTGDGSTLAGPRWAVGGPGTVWRGSAPALGPVDDALLRPALDAVAGQPTRTTLEELAAELGGRGPGLTPAGDDVLAGLVLVARIAGGEPAEPGLADLVAGVRTTEVSRAFLAWAARGQSIAPAHDWLDAVAAGDAAEARRALARLHAVGADSGRHLGAGLALGLCRTGAGQLPRVVSQTARATAGPSLRQRT
ncbi:DUF2877 domain-containing protein [Actinomycetospora chlora]|uniref:DUF2877 domain-containing protein n=1 Tax=Actinomycetospora chlora TaxID=663608 RepID=A0ABP9A8Y7_9PSEU